MSASNEIEFCACCPNCRKKSALIRAQTYIAGSHGGDARGPFACQLYKLGEAMRWYPKNDNSYSSWTLPNDIPQIDGRPNEVIEICAAYCMACELDELEAAILFKDVTPVRVMDLGFQGQLSSIHEYIRRHITGS